MTLSHRLDRLHRRYPPRPARPQEYDLSMMTFDDRIELDAILAKLDGVPTLPNGRPDLSPLSDAELERLHELADRVTVRETL